jgi:hypothetical protein
LFSIKTLLLKAEQQHFWLSVLAFMGGGESELCHLRSAARAHQNELIKGELCFARAQMNAGDCM